MSIHGHRAGGRSRYPCSQCTIVLHHLTLADEAFIARPFVAHHVVKYQISSVC